MVIGPTLGRYFALRTFRAIAGVFCTVVVLIFLIDFVELMRRSDSATASAPQMALLSLYRTPSIGEQVLPFAVLFGAMSAMLALSRKLELVVARSAGVSVWEFLQPATLVALTIGVFMTAVYNPVSARLKQEATQMEATLFGRGVRAMGRETWIRQRSIDGQAVIRAMATDANGNALSQATFFLYSPAGEFMDRIEAKTATIREGYWDLADVRVISIDSPPENFERYVVATNLRPEQVRQSFVPALSVPFWDLPPLIAQLRTAGLDSTRYQLQYQALLAKPLLLVAMVMIASTVSLRFFRMGGVAKMVLGGVAAGFVLYVTRQLVEDLGANGFLNVAAAAWTPGAVAALAGGLVLLHLEDG